jgi:ubiquinone/menaquinone biosynthesis C-methylase UbiE
MNTTTDAARYFDRLAGSWDRRFTTNGSMRDRLARFRSALSARLTPGAKVLDFGCGTGDISAEIELAGFRVVGVDRSEQMIQRARANHPASQIRFETLSDTAGVGCLPFRESEFDCVLASSVLEYIHDPGSCFAEMHRVAAPNAWMYMTVPNVYHPIRIAEMVALNLATFLEPVAPMRLRSHLQYIKLSVNRFGVKRWTALLRSRQWECVEVSGYFQPLLMIVSRKVR